ncbi:hypothetical protein TTHERM_00122110 (macronuclear) [Tetrahymena thermophila SB210]|uniref:TH1 domain-containing protein n=1 Tax=Tetrahymena thermophila (strain SB210) TaxID=312017 RepID=Q22YV9_TETTS|nr:hypothetical protein TTHERM_00122110 [Tetrahymena thermophila SB210]EAR90562.2 hypothetical protein TTHERM_00122110 [Tetrahymena thermophila SB210]|eukprot:XP_001010807.2 hypothetical protein TTHERM_00122110 [Tetrahymena thermophila SB210]
MGQSITLNKSAILYEIAQSVIKRKFLRNFDNKQDEYLEVRTDSNKEYFILENKKLQQQVKQKSDEIETLKNELKKYSSSPVQFQNQACEFTSKYIQNINEIIDSYQDKLLNLLIDEQNTPKNLLNNGKISFSVNQIFQDGQCLDIFKQFFKQEVGNLFSNMKTAIESMLNNKQKILPSIQDYSDHYYQFICETNDAFKDNSMQSSDEIAIEQENQLNSYHVRESNKFNYLKQVLDQEGNSPSNQQTQNLSKHKKKQSINKIRSSSQKLEAHKTAFEQDLIQKLNKCKDSFEIKLKSQTRLQFGNNHSKEANQIDNLFLEDFESSSYSDYKDQEDKDFDSETSISIPKKMNPKNSIQNQSAINSREESDFQEIQKLNKIRKCSFEKSFITSNPQNSQDNQKFKQFKNEDEQHKYFKTEKFFQEKQREQIMCSKKKIKHLHHKTSNHIVSRCASKKFSIVSQKSIFYQENQQKINSQTNLKPKELSSVDKNYSHSSTQLTNMDFCQAKDNRELLKIIHPIDENHFFSDKVVKYSRQKKSEKKIIVLNSKHFYVLSQDPLEKHKQFQIEDISKIIICPNNKQLCSIQIKKQFQLIIEVPHVRFFIKYILNHFKNVLKKNPPEIKIQKITMIFANNCHQNNISGQNLVEEQTTKSQFNANQSDQKNQSKVESDQLSQNLQTKNCLKAFILKNSNNLLEQIQDENWVEGFLIQEKDKIFSSEDEQIFEIENKLEVQAEANCFMPNQKIFKFSDQESNNYHLKLKQDFDIPLLIKSIKGGYKQYLYYNNRLNS